MHTTLFRILIALLALTLAPLSYAAGNSVEKFALVIGNRDYEGMGRELGNTIRDADLMAQSLRQLDFNVTELTNLSRSQMHAEVARFAENLPQGATSFVYYAGHGMQISGSNYLIPVDMLPTSEQSVPIKAYPLKTLLERLSAAKSVVNIVVLDACRNNPFLPRDPIRYRNFANLGLAPVQAPRGTLIAYSTSPGQLAADGRDGNSIYTATLAKTILEPKLEVREIFEKVASQVRKRTLDDQIPWIEGSLTEKYFFQPPEGISVVAGKPLVMADAGKRDGRYRGASKEPLPALPPAPPSNLWYQLMNPGELDTLHWEIEQRAKRMTADEVPALEHKAKGGSLVHQTTLGIAYREGIDKAVDASTGKITRYNANNTKALAWLTRAAEAGFPIAQVELAEMYFSGHGVDRDLSKSRYWLNQVSAGGYTRFELDAYHLDLTERTMAEQADPYLRGVQKMK